MDEQYGADQDKQENVDLNSVSEETAVKEQEEITNSVEPEMPEEESEMPKVEPQYTDPNEGVHPQYSTPQQGQNNYQNQYQYSYGNYNQGSQNANSNYNPSPNYNQEDDKKVMTMGDWLLTLLAFMIPCAGIILYFVWAFSNGGNQNRKNFCRAYLIIAAIGMVLGAILWGVIFASIGSSMRYYY